MSKFKYFSAIWKCKDLTSTQKHILIRMIYVGKLNNNAVHDIYITHETIAEDLGLSVRTVKYATKVFEEKQILINNKPHKYAKNNFTILLSSIIKHVDNPVQKSGKTQELLKELRAMIAPTSVQKTTLQSATIAHKQGNNRLCDPSLLLKDATQQKEKRETPVFDEYIPAFEIEEKIRRMRKYGDIPPCIKINDYELLEQIMFHIEHRSTRKTSSARHAYHSAIKMIKSGRWKTPNKYKDKTAQRVNS